MLYLAFLSYLCITVVTAQTIQLQYYSADDDDIEELQCAFRCPDDSVKFRYCEDLKSLEAGCSNTWYLIGVNGRLTMHDNTEGHELCLVVTQDLSIKVASMYDAGVYGGCASNTFDGIWKVSSTDFASQLCASMKIIEGYNVASFANENLGGCDNGFRVKRELVAPRPSPMSPSPTKMVTPSPIIPQPASDICASITSKRSCKMSRCKWRKSSHTCQKKSKDSNSSKNGKRGKSPKNEKLFE